MVSALGRFHSKYNLLTADSEQCCVCVRGNDATRNGVLSFALPLPEIVRAHTIDGQLIRGGGCRGKRHVGRVSALVGRHKEGVVFVPHHSRLRVADSCAG